MSQISEKEFAKVCRGILDDRESIFKHNPIGSQEETLLWVLMGALQSYMNLIELEIPRFNGNGKPEARDYRGSIMFLLNGRKKEDFDEAKYLKWFAKK